MSESTALSAAKRKIAALLAKTIENGASEAEALIAMNKAGELMLQYNLSMDEVTLRDERCVTKYLSEPWGNRDALWHCFDGLSKFCGVKTWVHSYDRKRKSWAFFGLESDVDLTLYLCRVILNAEKTELANYKDSEHYRNYHAHRRTASRNFVAGFGGRLNSRLNAMARENREAERKAHAYHAEQAKGRMIEADARVYTEAPQGTALICLAKEEKIEAEFNRVGPKLRSTRATSSGRYDPTARDYGAQAGQRVNLGRPINGGAASGLLK
ncbi:MAG: DUF2786 domain-containing protein [Betaproteobacteria bacterium]